MVRRLAFAVLPLLTALQLGFGCDGDSAVSGSQGPQPVGSGASLPDAGTGNGAGGGAGGNGASDAGTSPVYLAVTPNAIGDDGAPPTASDQLLAELTVYAAGVRAMVVALRWDAVDQTNTSALKARIEGYVARGLRVVLVVMPVDHHASHLPPALAGSGWDSAESIAAFEATIEALLSAVGSSLAALVLGRDADAYASHRPSEAAALAALLEAGVVHASRIDPALPRAVGLRFVGSDPPDDYLALLSLGDVAALSYRPGAGLASLPTDLSPAKDLDAMIMLAEGRAVVLHSVGYTSEASLGGSLDAQREMLDAFFAALLPRRASFRYVNVTMLHDLPPAECDAFAAEQGLASGDPLAAYSCAGGLRDGFDEPKAAWDALLEASAKLASP